MTRIRGWWAALAAAAALVLLAGCGGGSGGAMVASGPATSAVGTTATSGAGGGLAALASAVASGASSAAGAGTGAASATASTAASEAASAKAGGSPSPTTTAASMRTLAGGDYLQFSTPSKNIGCYLTQFDVRCDIADKTWTLPKPAGCELDYGNGLSVTVSGPAEVVCAGDTVLGGATVIGYDQGVAAGELQCVVSKAGVMCRNTATGHGFTLAREAHTEF